AMAREVQCRQFGGGRRDSCARTKPRVERCRLLAFEGLESRRLLSLGIKEIPFPTPNTQPFWTPTETAPELFVTALGTNQIVSFNPSSRSFRSFPVLGGSLGGASYITTGPSTNLFFTAPALTPLQ